MPTSDMRQPQAPSDTFSARQTAELTCQPSHETAAARAGMADAVRVITGQYAAGIDLDTIDAHRNYVSAALASDARSSYGQAYAAQYAETTRTLIAGLWADVAAARTERPAAGAPHPARPGWIADRSGVYVHERGELAPPRAVGREADAAWRDPYMQQVHRQAPRLTSGRDDAVEADGPDAYAINPTIPTHLGAAADLEAGQ